MYRRGFTIVELLIVIAVMGILLAVGVVNLRGSQANARDSARKADVANITLALETYYKSGNSDNSIPSGSYPGTDLTDSTATTQNAVIVSTLRDIDPASLVAPGLADANYTYRSLVSAPSNAVDAPTASAFSNLDINHFVYQPLQADGSLCTSSSTGTCRKFYIYYKLEDGTFGIATSKNQ